MFVEALASVRLPSPRATIVTGACSVPSASPGVVMVTTMLVTTMMVTKVVW
ncbi:MAG: hypothetical protein ABW252_12905 [Polyangiales bacterium]